MAQREQKTSPCWGFLTVVEHEQFGLFGGYLLLNTNGRPLEFHCTAPVKPNRAQQILYGPTLEPYLYGEHIGQSLLAKASQIPLAIFTDLRAMLAVREYATQPVAWAIPENNPGLRIAATPTADKLLQPQIAELLNFSCAGQSLAVWPDRYEDQNTLQAVAKEFELALDLQEPFGRIRGAIEEAQKLSAKAA
ncbi:MAG: hypothetical protein SFX18_17130 [Pirellulales bacterium]|nr:hypothetical protein [Pirellulales bacterium]